MQCISLTIYFDNDFHFYNINKNNKKHYSNIFKENMNL